MNQHLTYSVKVFLSNGVLIKLRHAWKNKLLIDEWNASVAKGFSEKFVNEWKSLMFIKIRRVLFYCAKIIISSNYKFGFIL